MSDQKHNDKSKSYHIIIDNTPFWVDTPTITGAQLKELAKVGSDFGVWLEQHGPEDRPIGDSEYVDLAGDGTERFFTGKKETTEGLETTFIPSTDRKYLRSKGLDFKEVDANGVHGLVIKDYPLPEGRYDRTHADVLVILPSGYNDVGPDMFHLYPWVKLMPEGQYARAANAAVTFDGVQWQRWSRHSAAENWRSGVDGVSTVIARIRNALEVART